MDTSSDLLSKVIKGEVKFHELDNLATEKEATIIRRKALEKILNLGLKSVSSSVIDPKSAKPNIENMIGGIQMPLGIAGPVKVRGDFASGEFYLPLATTEGALVASVSRGCSAINKSGGAVCTVLKNEQTRSILFKAKSLKDVKEFTVWVDNSQHLIKKFVEGDDLFLEVASADVYSVGLNVWLRVKADTKDAMGMNMITIACKKIAENILALFDLEFAAESGNMCTDKKPSAMNLVNSRGKKVAACVSLSSHVIEKVLKTTPEDLVKTNYRKNLLGGAASFSMGFNAHFANVVAAMFIACGQDEAHTVGGSLGFTTVEPIKDGVNFCVTLQSLQVGTVGGGTSLPTQKECLQIMQCFGSGNPPGSNSKKLAEIISAAVLAGEISLLAAICSKDLAKAHEELNR